MQFGVGKPARDGPNGIRQLTHLVDAHTNETWTTRSLALNKPPDLQTSRLVSTSITDLHDATVQLLLRPFALRRHTEEPKTALDVAYANDPPWLAKTSTDEQK